MDRTQVEEGVVTATEATTPIDVREDPPTPKRNNAVRVLVVVAILAGGLAVLATNLTQSTTYFKTADEAVDERGALGDRRFRVEGLVTEPVEQVGDEVRFAIMSAGVCVPVQHTGSPPELFKPGIPVVLEGRWNGEVYESDQIMVRHSNEYKEKNADRLQEAASQQDEYASCAS